MFSRRSLPTMMILILAVSAVALAQQPQTPAPDNSMRGERMREREGRRHEKMARHGAGRLPGMRELNLTEEQQQKHRAIMQRHMESTRTQREELSKLRDKREAGTFSADDAARAKALRQEIQDSRQSIHSEIQGILTTEQRTKLEQLRNERKARHEEMRSRRPDRQNRLNRRNNIPG